MRACNSATRLHGPDGQWTALMLRAIPSHDGVFEGAAIAFLNLSYFEDFYRAVELNESGAILLHLRDGTVLARYPHTDAVIGESYADLPPFKDILAHGLLGHGDHGQPDRRQPSGVGDPGAEGVSASGQRLGWGESGAGGLATANLDLFAGGGWRFGGCFQLFCCCWRSARAKSRRCSASTAPPKMQRRGRAQAARRTNGGARAR